MNRAAFMVPQSGKQKGDGPPPSFSVRNRVLSTRFVGQSTGRVLPDQADDEGVTPIFVTDEIRMGPVGPPPTAAASAHRFNPVHGIFADAVLKVLQGVEQSVGNGSDSAIAHTNHLVFILEGTHR